MISLNRLLLLLIFPVAAFADSRDSVIAYTLPDSLKASSLLSTISVSAVPLKKESYVGIKTTLVSLSMAAEKNERSIVFRFPKNSVLVAKGQNVESEDNGELEWEFNWKTNTAYKLLIATATDSAGNFSLYSGYIYLPETGKWKLLGTAKISGGWSSIGAPAFFQSDVKKSGLQSVIKESWCQLTTGAWKNLSGVDAAIPVLMPFSNIDSADQFVAERRMIENGIQSGAIKVSGNIENVYYDIMEAGNGKQVKLQDTVTVNYKGYVLNGEVFDQTRDKPATFPLQRLIKGWQLALPYCREGGKIKIIIPSVSGYAIRTRSPKIPPNSILVFEIEVLATKSPLQIK